MRYHEERKTASLSPCEKKKRREEVEESHLNNLWLQRLFPELYLESTRNATEVYLVFNPADPSIVNSRSFEQYSMRSKAKQRQVTSMEELAVGKLSWSGVTG